MFVQEHVALRDYTTWQTGGVARYFITVSDETELVAALTFAVEHELPHFILGGGSNVLVADSGFGGVVIHLTHHAVTSTTEADTVLVTAEAGKTFDELVAEAVQSGWWGLENLSHIPGSVGATPVQNVGAYGVEVGDCIDSVRVYDQLSQAFTTLTQSDCQFGYRDSRFKREPGRYIITAVTFRLHTIPQPQLSYRDLATYFSNSTPSLRAIREAVIAIRSAKFPDWHTVGTAGSFFKNPIISGAHYETLVDRYPELPGFEQPDGMVKVPLGWILDKVLGLKGQGTETVGCYAGQALVLYNKGGATTADVVAFAEAIAQRVYEATEIIIAWEVTLVGEV